MTQEQRLAAAEGLTEVLARTTGTADHPTGLARVTATATGELKSLDLHPNALAQGADAVGRLVVETARLATDAAVQTSYNELAKSLGDSMAMAVEAFAGPPPLRTALDRAATRPSTGPDAPHPGPPGTVAGAGGWSAAQPGGPGWSGPSQRPAEPGRSGTPQRPSEPGWTGSRPGGGGRPATPPRTGEPGWSGTPPRTAEPAWSPHRPTDSGWSGAQQHPAHPAAADSTTTAAGPTGRPAPPWAGQQANRPAPRAEAQETDDDDYFSDPFRGQRQ